MADDDTDEAGQAQAARDIAATRVAGPRRTQRQAGLAQQQAASQQGLGLAHPPGGDNTNFGE